MKKNNETIYVSPRVKAVDIKTQAMLCQSKQSITIENDTFTSGDSDDPWAN